eukprot:COSAG03_NODE_751_length_5994_cov_17.493130_6_plen_153_part_00
MMADAEFDSFVTIGMGGPALSTGALSSIGIDFAAWTETAGLNLRDGAVFFRDRDHGAEVEPVVFMQLTVPTGTQFSGQLSAQGRAFVGEDWESRSLQFSTSPSPPPPNPFGQPSLLPPDAAGYGWSDPGGYAGRYDHGTIHIVAGDGGGGGR